MRLILSTTTITCSLLLSACTTKGSNPVDPYESLNRKIHTFNMAFDATMLKPPARLYKAVVPAPVRAGINNAYNNVNMLPTVANDLLQGEWQYAYKDTWRFIANTTIGIGGIFDVASRFSLPPRSNDLGITFAKWGNKQSPFIVIPLLGPSTIRDGMGQMFDYALFTPYPYIKSDALLYSLLGLRYIDIRSQMFDTERLISESYDQYSFIRDAYLQRRNFLITGEQAEADALYIDDENDSVLTETPANGSESDFPLTTAQYATHHATTT